MKTVLEASEMTVDPAIARAKVAEYRQAVKERHLEEDAAILRGYRAIAKGHKVIDLPHVISLGGVFEQTQLPRLAIATADMDFVHVDRDSTGRVTFSPEGRPDSRRVKDVFRCPPGTLPATSTTAPWRSDWWGSMRAMIPHVPPSLRPAHSLRNYAILFEVDEWARVPRPPSDPALLKHLGGDLYAVLAVWDLTPLEQAVLMGRVRAS